MTAPFLDLSLVVSHLRTALVPDTVREVRELGSQAGADPSQGATLLPRIIVVGEARQTRAVGGLAHHERLEERVLLIVQVGEATRDDARASSALRAACESIHDSLHEATVASGWQPARYQGGRLLSIDDTTYSWAERYALLRPC